MAIEGSSSNRPASRVETSKLVLPGVTEGVGRSFSSVSSSIFACSVFTSTGGSDRAAGATFEATGDSRTWPAETIGWRYRAVCDYPETSARRPVNCARVMVMPPSTKLSVISFPITTWLSFVVQVWSPIAMEFVTSGF